MGNIRFEDNKILFDGNSIAMHEDCCCDEYTNNCSVCYAANQTPKYIEFISTGITDCGDGDCSGVNGTFILESNAAMPCYWNYVGASHSVTLRIGDYTTKRAYIYSEAVGGVWCYISVRNDDDCDITDTSGNLRATSAACTDPANEGYGGSASWSVL